MDEFEDSSGSGFDASGLIESLANNATSAYETTQALNANPLNTALVYGGTAQTAQGSTYGASALSAPTVPSSGLLLLLVAGGILLYAATR